MDCGEQDHRSPALRSGRSTARSWLGFVLLLSGCATSFDDWRLDAGRACVGCSDVGRVEAGAVEAGAVDARADGAAFDAELLDAPPEDARIVGDGDLDAFDARLCPGTPRIVAPARVDTEGDFLVTVSDVPADRVNLAVTSAPATSFETSVALSGGCSSSGTLRAPSSPGTYALRAMVGGTVAVSTTIFVERRSVADDAGAPCPLPWGGSLESGASVVAYRQTSCDETCSSFTRTCRSSGDLSGSSSYGLAACLDCSASWQTTPVGSCSAASGGGTRSRLVRCVRDLDGAVVATSECSGTRPEATEDCNLQTLTPLDCSDATTANADFYRGQGRRCGERVGIDYWNMSIVNVGYAMARAAFISSYDADCVSTVGTVARAPCNDDLLCNRGFHYVENTSTCAR